jgi:UDP-2-acetamido-3-amino-2,3-dideoxy-glucuronate N-acetyltransferase
MGADSIVNKKMTDYNLLVWNPARRIGRMSVYSQWLSVDIDGKAQCAESKEWYQIMDSKVIKEYVTKKGDLKSQYLNINQTEDDCIR